jgi:hypothetical protein
VGKNGNVQTLKLHWRGPFVVVLSTPTTVKVAEIVLWIHHSQVAHCSHVGAPAYCRIRVGPAFQETTGDHRQQDVRPAPVTLETLVYTQQKLEELPISPLRMSLSGAFLLILVSSLPGDPSLWTVTHVCAPPKWKVLLSKLWFSMLNYSCADLEGMESQ